MWSAAPAPEYLTERCRQAQHRQRLTPKTMLRKLSEPPLPVERQAPTPRRNPAAAATAGAVEAAVAAAARIPAKSSDSPLAPPAGARS